MNSASYFGRYFFWIAVIAVAIFAATPAVADKRVALVLGVSNYRSVQRLPNPNNDAAAISDTFKRQMLFDVVDLRQDLGVMEMRRAVREFAVVAADADIAVVYYAGHGIEVNGTNYIIPADARLQTDFDVEDEAISLDRILQAINPAKRLRLVIMDACRDNPFAEKITRSMPTRSIGRGLARIEPTTSDTLIAFAAKAGAVAGDGDGAHSPFSTALLSHIATPGLDLRLALGRVRDDVLKSTSYRQEPFVYGSLGGDTVALVPAIVPPTDPDAKARHDYELAAQLGTKEAWKSFILAHGNGIYADFAHAALDKLEAAEKASEKAELVRRQAEEQARQKNEEIRRQIEEQAARQTEQAKQQISEQARRDLEKERQRLAEQSKRELDDAKRQLAEARRQAEDAAIEVEQAKKRAAADAQRQIDTVRQEAERQAVVAAALSPQKPDPSPIVQGAAVAMDPGDIARLLQAHLKRVGCDPGLLDGSWSSGSQRALASFNSRAGTRFDVKVASLDALDAVRSKADRVCPLACGKGQKVVGDHCAPITCDSDFILSSEGVCQRRLSPAPKPKTVSLRQPAVRTRSGRDAGAPRGCHSFGGQLYCE